jgi:hypothetical protein
MIYIYIYICVCVCVCVCVYLTSVGLNPVAVVQHTVTHKQYTEYRERNIHSNPTVIHT